RERRVTPWQRPRKETSRLDPRSCDSRRLPPFRCGRADLPLRSPHSKRPCYQIARVLPHRAGGNPQPWQSEQLLLEELPSNLQCRDRRGISRCHCIAVREPARVSKISRRIDMPEVERARLNRPHLRQLGIQRSLQLAKTNQLVRREHSFPKQ